MYVECEVFTSSERIDMLLKTPGYPYIFEFKLKGSAEEALKQIEDKGYALPYLEKREQIFKIGVNFSSEKRNIESLNTEF